MGFCFCRLRRLDHFVRQALSSFCIANGASTPLHHNYTISFENQITQWNAYARSVLHLPSPRTLVALFIGINDISDTSKWTFPRSNITATSFPELYTDIITAEFAAVETIYEAGYRNFLIMNLPPLERTPGNVVPGATPHPNATMVKSYNSILIAQARQFAAKHPGTNAMVFDTYSFLSGILEDPAPYGIKNTTGYCPQYNAPDIATNYATYGCLPIPDYFWYNTGHITYRVHELLAAAVKRFLVRGGK
jgi:phospholipase/lecithinase/hemolysin